MTYFNNLSSDDVVFATAAFLANRNGHTEIINYIKETIELKDLEKIAILYAVAENGNLSMLKTLMSQLKKEENVVKNSKTQQEYNPNKNMKAQQEYIGNDTKPNANFMRGVRKNQKEVNEASTSKTQKEVTIKHKTNQKEINETKNIQKEFKSNPSYKQQKSQMEVTDDSTNQQIITQQPTSNKVQQMIHNLDSKPKHSVGGNVQIVPTNIKNEELLSAAKDGNIASLKKLLNEGLYIDVLDSWNMTPLMHALFNGNEKAAHFLLDQGANVHWSDSFGRFPIHLAATSCSKAIVKELIEKRADILEIDLNGKTALDYANDEGNEKVAKYLLKCGNK